MKNKMLSLLLSAALTLGCAVPAFAAEDGLPASDAPAVAEAAESGLWITAEAVQALAFAKSVNDGESYQGQYISLNSDIDLSGIDWTPIGTSNSFKGVFDGNQYVIENLTIGSQAAAAERDAAGLFGDLGSGGVIRSVGIRNASIYNYYAGSQYVGLLASGTSANSVVDNCWATGTIASGGTSTDTEKYSNIGGLIGASGLKSLVANSWSDVTILSVSDTINAVGGIVGWTSNQSAVVNCAAFGNISDSCGIDDSFSAVGGVVGYSSGTVYACYSGGDGSKADPYVISTEEHLRAFAAATVSGKLVTANRYFRLGADIALSGAWTPIHNFAGSFDGDGHTVSGMTIGTETSPAGSAAVGTAAASPKTSAKGGLITVTVTPESGYALGRLTAKDESGRELALTNKGSGRYTFVMPASNVTVEVSFTKSGANRFADVPSGAYYGDAVAWAVENDIAADTSETAFSPDAAVTRAQIVTFLFRNSQAK